MIGALPRLNTWSPTPYSPSSARRTTTRSCCSRMVRMASTYRRRFTKLIDALDVIATPAQTRPLYRHETPKHTDTPILPPPTVPTDDRVSSSTQDPINPSLHPPPTPPAVYPLVPRAAWMLEGDHRSDAEADADWRRAMEQLLPSSLPPSLPTWRQAQVDALLAPPLPPPPWPAPAWGSNPDIEPSHEPDSHLSRRNGRRTVMIRAIDPDHLLRHEPPPAPGPRRLPTQDYASDDSLESYASAKTRRTRVPKDPPATAQPQPSQAPVFLPRWHRC